MANNDEENVCEDVTCAAYHERKLFDLSQGITELENILNNMTGMCQATKCTAGETPSVSQPSKGPCPQIKPESQRPKSAFSYPLPVLPPLKPIVQTYKPNFDAKTCKGTVCANAYMGYNMLKLDNTCEDNTCTANEGNKDPCCRSTCIFALNAQRNASVSENARVSSSSSPRSSDSPPIDTTPRGSSGTYPNANIRTSLNTPFSSFPRGSAGAYPSTGLNTRCGSPSCSSGKKDIFSSLTASAIDSIYPSSLSYSNNNPFSARAPMSIGVCGRKKCPYASTDNAGVLDDYGNMTSNFPTNSYNNYNSPSTSIGANANVTCGCCAKPQSPPQEYNCGGIPCPLNEQITAPCGNKTCPYNNASASENVCGGMPCPATADQTEICQNKTCPYADSAQQDTCQNVTCPYAQAGISGNFPEKIISSGYPQSTGPCGSPECPMASLTSPGALTSCPYALKVKRYPCGSPSCPYINPSGILQTHQYTGDLSYVQEASRPYCGSASPYDYLSSMDRNYPSPFANNYSMFPKTDPPPLVEPCPYMPKKKKSCGQPSCPFLEKEEEKENFCVGSSCPYGIGICGGLRMYSCDQKNVEPCGSPECLITKPEETEAQPQSQGRTASQAANNNACAQFLLKWQNRRKSNKSGTTTKSICSDLDTLNMYEDENLPELLNFIFDEGEESPNSKCNTLSCPYLKKLIFCEGCGGVLPDLDLYDEFERKYEASIEGIQSAELEEDYYYNYNVEKTIEIATMQRIQEVEEDSPLMIKDVSLYSYPGVQLGHKDCMKRRRRVPSNMGWLWTLKPTYGNPELWRGYKPGSISKGVFKIMKKYRKLFGLIDATEVKKKKNKAKGPPEDLRHCIEVKKKDGEYDIIVNPVKDPKTRDPIGNPYMEVTPMQFKVGKEEHEKEPAYCPCDEIDDEAATSTICSEFDFHFTPPCAIPDAFPKKVKEMIEIETQYNIMDLPPELRGSRKGSGKKGKGDKGGKGGKGKKGGGKKKK